MTLPPDLAEKREAAIRYLRERGLWILDRGTPAPKWSSKTRSPSPTAQVIPMLKMMRRNEEAKE